MADLFNPSSWGAGSAQSPAQNLVVGSNTIPLNPMFTGLAVGRQLLIFGDAHPEGAPVTAIGANSVTVTCAYTHASAAWQIAEQAHWLDISDFLAIMSDIGSVLFGAAWGADRNAGGHMIVNCAGVLDQNGNPITGGGTSGGLSQVFTASAGQTTFAPSSFVPTLQSWVFLDGRKTVAGAGGDWTLSGGAVVFGYGLNVGSIVEIVQ